MSADLENLNKCLRLITEIRSNSYKVFNVASDGVSNDSNDRKFLSDLKSMLGKVGGLVGELEQSLSNQQPISNPLPLGHSVYMNLDAAIDNIAVYNDLVTSYKWMDKVHDYSNGAASFFSQNSLNWSYGKIAKSRGKRLTSTIQKGHPQALENLVNSVNRMYADMRLQISRPNKTQLNALVEVSLGRILTAVLIFKGLMIEWVVVKGFNEESKRFDGQLDVWSDSRYEVFRKITQSINAGMLNFTSPLYPDLSIKSFMTYLHSFGTVFTDKCKKCGCHLHNNLPPTWREFKTLEPYHEDCRP